VRFAPAVLPLVFALLLAGCATAPAPVPNALEDELPPIAEPPPVEVPPPLIESPPLEPVEPPRPAAGATPAPGATPTPAVPSPAPTPAPAPAVAPPSPAAERPVVVVPAPTVESVEELQMNGLLADLSRFSTLGPDELRRELSSATQALARQRSDVNRVRLGVLYTLVRSSPQDDLRALQLFDNVAKSGGALTPIKHLAAVLTAQVTERQRALREEQVKADQAVRKLDQLLEMERALLRDRVRSGGGGGGGGGAGGSGH